MSLRIFSALVGALLAAGCGGAADSVADGETVECAIGAGAELQPVCTLEVIGEAVFVVHGPGGGFRRFQVTEGAAAISAIDGASKVEQIMIVNGVVEFTTDSDRYRFAYELLNTGPR